MNIKSRKTGKVIIFDLIGRIVIGEDIYLLRKSIRDAMNEGFKNILFNLEGVSYIDSTGIGELVNCYTTAKNQNGTIKLLNISSKIKSVLQMTKLLTVFDTYSNENKAISSFKL